MSNDDVTKHFKPVWNLPLAVERNIDQQGGNRLCWCDEPEADDPYDGP